MAAGGSKNTEKKYVVVELLVTGETSPYQRSIEMITKSIRRYELALTKIQKRYKELEAAKMEASKRGTAYVGREKKSLDEIKRLIAINNEQWKRTKTNLDSNRKAFNEYKKDVTQGTKDITKEQSKQEKATVSQEDAMKRLAMQVISITAAYALLKKSLGFLISSFTEFEYTLMNVQTLLNETDRTLGKGSIDLMKKYGFAVEDVNKALFDAISAMIPARSSIEFLGQASRLAIGGVTDLKVAVDGLTSIINAYSLEVSEAGRVADAFFRAQKWGKTTVQDLVENIGRLAPVASIAGVSYQEMLSALSELTLGGLDTRESVTVLRQAIAGLIKPAAEAEEALRKYNVPVGIAEVSNAGLSYSLGKLMEAYAEYPDIVAEMIPNIRAFTGVTALTAERLLHLNMITEDVMNNWGEFSSLTSAFAKQMTTNEIKMRRFRAELKAIGIEYGEKLKPLFVFAVENFRAITGAVVGLTVAFIAYYTKAVLIPKINALITASFKSMAIAVNAFTAGLSLVIGFAAAMIIAKKPVDDMAVSYRNVTDQISSTKRVLNDYFEELYRIDEVLNNATTSEDEHRKALERKRTLIGELNTSHGEYISDIITEQTELEKLKKLQDEANKTIERNIVLRNKIKESDRLQQALFEDVEPLYNRIQKQLTKYGVSKMEQQGQYYLAFDELLDDYRDARKELAEREINELKDLSGEALELRKEAYETEAELLRVNLTNETTKLFIRLFDEPNTKVAISVDRIISLNEKYAQSQAEVTAALDIFKDALSLNIEPKQLRGRSPEALSEFVKSEGIDTRANLGGLGYVNTLTEEYDEHRAKLFADYKADAMELINYTLKLQAEGYTSMEILNDKHAIELELKAQETWKKVVTSVTDAEKELIDQYNFYTKSALDDTKALTAAQKKDLDFARIKWFQQLRKNQIDHNKYMLNLQLSYIEDEINTFESGYNKEFQLLQINYLRRIAEVQANNEKEIELRKKQIEDQQYDQTQYEKEFKQMQIDLEREHNSKLLQEWRIYIEQRRRLIVKMNSDYEKYKENYIYAENEIIDLLQTRRDVLKSLIEDYAKLGVDQDIFRFILPDTNVLDDISKFGDSLLDLKNNFLEFSTDTITNFINNITLLAESLQKFYDDTLFKYRSESFSIESDFGITSLNDKFEFERIRLERELAAYRAGLIAMDAVLKQEDKLFNKEEYEEKIKLAERALKIAQDEEKLKVRKEYGVATYGDMYSVAYEKAVYAKDLGDITEAEFEKYIKELKRKYPKFLRNLTELEFERIQQIGNRVLDIGTNIVDQMFQYRAESDQREFERQMELLNDKHTTELDLLQNRLDKGLITEEKYQKQKEQIDAKYRRREEEQKRRQFEREKNRAASQAIIQGAVAAIRVLAELGTAGWAEAILIAGETAANVALIYSQKYKKGGIAFGDKAGIIGGKPHSAGGTKFFGEDGSMFEAERGELLAIVNKNSTDLLRSLSAVNSIYGRSYFKNGGIFDDGGMLMRDLLGSQSGFNYKDFVIALQNMPAPVVDVKEIISKAGRVTRIKDAATI